MQIKRTIDMYDDIIDLPHHESQKYPRMSMMDRAAQFAPFAALTGHSDSIQETARLTDHRLELSETQKVELDAKFRIVMQHIGEQTEYQFVYFIPDAKKQGGSYQTIHGIVKKVDSFKGVVVLADRREIKIEDVVEIHGVEVEEDDF